MAHLAEVQYEGGVWVLPVHLRVEEDDLPGAHHDVQLLPTVPPTTVGSITTTGTLPETLSLHAYKKNAIDWAKNYVQLQEVDGSGLIKKIMDTNPNQFLQFKKYSCSSQTKFCHRQK